MRRLDSYRVFLFEEFAASLFFAVNFTASTLYLVEVVGLNPFQLVLVGTVLEITAFIAEVPTGIIADVYSRRLSILIGFAVVGVGFLVEGLIPLFWAALLAQVIWGIGITFVSGALEAWLADEIGQERAGKAFLRGLQFSNAGALAGIGISVVLGSVALNIPLLASGIAIIALAGVLALIMPETGFKPTPREDRNTFQQMAHTFRAGAGLVRQRRILLILLIAGVFFGAYSEGFDRLWIPRLLEFPVPYFEPVVWVGIIGAVSLVLETGLTELVRRRVDTNNQVIVARTLRLTLALVMALTAVYGLAWNFGVALITVLALRPVRAMNYPLAMAWVNQHVESSVRATVFSIRNQADALGQIVGGPILGAIATLGSVSLMMVVSATFLAPAVWLYGKATDGE